MRDQIRVASVQFKSGVVERELAFYDRIDFFVRMASEYGCDFIAFPEFLTFSLLTLKPDLAPEEAMSWLSGHTPRFVDRLRDCATKHGVNIIGGTQPVQVESGALQNQCHIALRDGSVHVRAKIHPTPDERSVWGIAGGDAVDVIATDCGPVGVAICYDAEFPEIHRRLADQGARIIFTPYSTDTRHGHLRVTYCCQARAVENQCYIVTAGGTGLVEGVANFEMQYASSGIYTPCDLPFAWNGIAAEAGENVETVIFADLDLARLDWARREGAVQNLNDRRSDLYQLHWTGS